MTNWLSARLPSTLKLWSSKSKLFFAQLPSNIYLWISKTNISARLPWSLAAQKRSFSARLPSKTKLCSSKTKLFCETSFKNEAVQLKNETFLRDFLRNRSFEDQKRSISARFPSKMKLWSSKTKLLCETSFKNESFEDQKRSISARLPFPKWKFEAQKRSFCARLPSKMKLWRSKTKLFCEASFKNETVQLKNEAFLRDFLQKRSCAAQKRNFSARLPSKSKLWRSKTKHFCEISFKNEALKLKNEAFVRDFLQKWKLWRSKTKHFCETSFQNESLKLKNEAFVRDFLQKWSFEAQKRSFCARLPSKMTCWPDTWPQNSNTF